MKEIRHYVENDACEDQFVYKLYARERLNFGCQYDYKRHNTVCTCKNTSQKRSERSDMRYFSGSPKQVYAYHGSRSITDVGVGSVKVLKRRNVKKVYMPDVDDRGVGSSDLSSFINRRTKLNSYYDYKKTSSKCVGGFVEYNPKRVVSEKLSPIVQTTSGTTSPSCFIDQKNIETGINTIDKSLVTTGTQFEEYVEPNKENDTKLRNETPRKSIVIVSEQTQKNNISTEMQSKNEKRTKKVTEVEKVFSSDSLVQHIYNLEEPSDEKQNGMYIDPMENKLEREYRKMFLTEDKKPDSKASVDKTIPELKSASILRKRFEALRRGLKKDDAIKNVIPSSHDSVHICKDVSVTSDPPSLEGRSYSNTKRYSPTQSNIEQDSNRKREKTEKNRAPWPKSDIESDCQGVKGMFKLWGKKFNFEEEEKRRAMPPMAIDISKKPRNDLKNKDECKKRKRKFFFFKKRSKGKLIKKEQEITKPYKPSGVTAGRCEIKDGMTLKIGATTMPKEQISRISEEGDDIQRRTWLQKFLANTIESARSVNIRWNNSMYATSSSTVFELMDTIYRNYGDIIKSKSEFTTDETSSNRSYTKNKVNFDQNIQAWMIRKTIPDRPREIPVWIRSDGGMKERNIEVNISDQRWFIEKSRAFANKIEVVLRSRNINKFSNNVSSEYLRIDIPKDFFDITSSDESKQHPTSDEEVYKIVDYESVLDTKRSEKADHACNNIEVIVSVQDSQNLKANILETVIKRPPMQRDVVIQGSNVNIPKRCDVIGVGIITQREMRDVLKKSILNFDDNIIDDDSEDGFQTVQKKCDFAESILRNYYKQWTPLGLDPILWRASDSQLRSSSENSLISSHNRGDGSKSCPNMYDDFRGSTLISSCETSCCSQRNVQEPCGPCADTFSRKVKKIFEMTAKAKTEADIPGKRVLPKDSFEVFRKRKIYASSNKSNWACADDHPVSVPSNQSKCCISGTPEECPTLNKPICHPPRSKTKSCKKHVSMPDFESLVDQMSDKTLEGILAFKGQAGCDACKIIEMKCPKHAAVKSKPICVIPSPPCKISCEKMKKPPCTLSPRGSPRTKTPKSPNTPVFAKDQACDPPSICKPVSPCGGTSPLRQRRKACPNITPLCKITPPCSPPIPPLISPPRSNCSSPKPSHNCLSPVNESAKKSSPKKKGCNMPKTSSESLCCSPQRSQKLSSPGSPGLNLKSSSNSLKNKKSNSKKQSTKKTVKSSCKCDEFPWPINNQISNPPSPTSSSEHCDKSKAKNTCDSNCSMSPKLSTVPPSESPEQRPVKRCKPDCANRKKRSPQIPIPQKKNPENPLCPAKQQKPKPCPENNQKPCPEKQKLFEITSKKISGIFLKMKAPKKNTCVNDCAALLSHNEVETGVVRLNSRERITIRIKNETPSTEEIRDGMNVKVQDEDGQTLFERKAYTCNHHEPSVLGDMYRDSNLNKVSTPIMLVTNKEVNSPKQSEVVDYASDPSLANLIEIQFQLRITQGDKTTEISIADDEDKFKKPNDIVQVAPEVFLAENKSVEQVIEDTAPKNDINIKILVKNFKPKHKFKNKIAQDEYSKKIKDKFHTVSTDGIADPNNDNIFSVHRATVDNEAGENSKTSSKLSHVMVSEELTEPINFMVSSHSTEHLATYATDNDDCATYDTKSMSSKKDLQDFQQGNNDDTNELSARDLDTDNDVVDSNSAELNGNQFYTKQEKKDLLKRAFEKSYNKPKNEENVRQLWNLLKMILTDSSDNDEINEASNEKVIKNNGLKKIIYRNTDSMSNYYKMESIVNLKESNETYSPFPTEECNSKTSTVTKSFRNRGCICSKVADRLNCDLKYGCCCRPKNKLDEITSCDLKIDQNKYKTKCAEVQVQNSKHLSTKTNSMCSRDKNAIIEKNARKAKIHENLVDKKVTQTFSPHGNDVKEDRKSKMKKLNRTTVLGISDDDKIILISEGKTKQVDKTVINEKENKSMNLKKSRRNEKEMRNTYYGNSDVLQCYETKKAVLEIYAEKTESENGEHLVAKLPRFVYEKESEITKKYKQISNNSYKCVCRKDIVRMSVN